jgi:hypothetical protein
MKILHAFRFTLQYPHVQLESIRAFADLEARELSHANLHPELTPRVTTPQRTITPSAATLLCRHR